MDTQLYVTERIDALFVIRMPQRLPRLDVVTDALLQDFQLREAAFDLPVPHQNWRLAAQE